MIYARNHVLFLVKIPYCFKHFVWVSLFFCTFARRIRNINFINKIVLEQVWKKVHCKLQEQPISPNFPVVSKAQ